MAFITTQLEGFGFDEKCDPLKGPRTKFVAKRSDIDFAAMLADPTAFDKENGVILRYILKPGVVGFVEVEFDRESATWDATRTSDNGFYEILETIVLEGQSVERTRKIRNMVANCDLVVHSIMASKIERVTGVEFDGEVFDRPFRKNRVVRHQDNAGTAGGDNARDELDFGGRMQYAPLYASVGVADMRGLVTTQGAAIYGVASTRVAYGDGDGTDAYGPSAVGVNQVLAAEVEAGQVSEADVKGEVSPTPKTKTSGKAK